MPRKITHVENTQELAHFSEVCNNFHHYPKVHGYHSLGFLSFIRPDVHWIVLVHNETWRLSNPISSKKVCDDLDREISYGISLGKSVCLVIWDEDVIPPPWPNFAEMCNRYRNENFFLITQLGPKQQLVYTYQGELQCKILEIPWWYLNDIIGYVRSWQVPKKISISENTKNFVCMINYWSNQQHKLDLLEQLWKKNLHYYGLMTVKELKNLPKHFSEFVIKSSNPMIFSNSNPEVDPMGAQYRINNLWVSDPVMNYHKIEQNYEMPLVINVESRIGIFFATEKSLWPALLGRLYLIYGQPGSMALIQRWHDVDQTEWANLEFDSHEGDWSRQSNLERLDLMLDRNRYLIMHAKEIYHSIRDKLERARWTIGPNVLKFCFDQLDKIPRQ